MFNGFICFPITLNEKKHLDEACKLIGISLEEFFRRSLIELQREIDKEIPEFYI